MKLNSGDEATMMRNWVPLHMANQWIDQKKQKHVVVVIVFASGVTPHNSTNCEISVVDSKESLEVK